MNLISVMLTDKKLESKEVMRRFLEELFTYFLILRPTTAACVNNRVTQNLSLHFSYMPKIISAMLRQKLEFIKHHSDHRIENASFLSRLMTNFNVYFANLEHYQAITEKHKIYDVLMYYKDLYEVDPSIIETADEVVNLVLKNKHTLVEFFEEVFSI
jgi:hypothetical protein